jgi:hypothetical protein
MMTGAMGGYNMDMPVEQMQEYGNDDVMGQNAPLSMESLFGEREKLGYTM